MDSQTYALLATGSGLRVFHKESYKLTILAGNDGGSPLLDAITLSVNVQLSFDSAATSVSFEKSLYRATIFSGAQQSNATLVTVVAVDTNKLSEGMISYVYLDEDSIGAHLFNLDESTGAVTRNRPLGFLSNS